MQSVQLHEDKFLKIFWEEKRHVIGIDWKASTSAMTGHEFRQELTLFADHVEKKHASGILVDVSNFRHKPDPDFTAWRVKNISSRYVAAGVKRFAFVFPPGAQIPPAMNQSSPEEAFQTRAFDGIGQAEDWLTGTLLTISHVHCRVKDLFVAVEWFTSKCGVVPSFSDARMAVLEFGPFALILDSASDDSVATIGLKSADCDTDFATMVARGARVVQPPQDCPYGARVACLQGPGALTIELEQLLSEVTD